MTMKNVSDSSVPCDGYDLPLFGIEEGYFYQLHIPTIACISISFICASISFIISFRRHRSRSFFSWTKCDRFIVYLAICDALFNLAHGTDHTLVVVGMDHVRPRVLCELLSFVTSVFCMAQNILVGIIAINIFIMICYGKNIRFGRCDWKLTLGTLGIPTVGACVAWCLGHLGPNGLICMTDGVKGWITFVVFYTVPLVAICIMNTVLYTLSWLKMRSEIKQLQKQLGPNPPSRHAALIAAKNMSLFVAAFFIQWFFVGVYGAWELFAEVPVIMLHLATKSTNIGGVLNLIVFVIVSKRRRKHKKQNLYSTQSSHLWKTDVHMVQASELCPKSKI